MCVCVARLLHSMNHDYFRSICLVHGDSRKRLKFETKTAEAKNVEKWISVCRCLQWLFDNDMQISIHTNTYILLFLYRSGMLLSYNISIKSGHISVSYPTDSPLNICNPLCSTNVRVYVS